MKIYCKFYISFLYFIFLICKIITAEEIRSNKLDKKLEKNPQIYNNTFDYLDSNGFFTKNKVEKKKE